MIKVTPNEFVSYARSKWLGAPFLIGGRSTFGVDCASFLLESAMALGAVPEYNPPTYGRRQLLDPEFLRGQIGLFCDKVPKDEIRIGDIPIFRLTGHRTHCSIISSETQMIHVDNPNGVVEVTFPGYWENLVDEVYRPRFYS